MKQPGVSPDAFSESLNADSTYMTNPKEEIHNLFEKAEEYIKTRIDLFKLKLVSKASDLLASFFSKVISLVFFSFFFIVLSIGLGFLLGEWLGRYSYGFLVLAGFYLILGIIINAFGDKWIKRPVANKLIDRFIK